MEQIRDNGDIRLGTWQGGDSSESQKTPSGAPPTPDSLCKVISMTIKLSSAIALGGSFTFLADTIIFPISNEPAVLATAPVMALLFGASGGSVIGNTVNSYCRGGTPDISLLHHGIRLFAVVVLGGSLMHLILSASPLATGDNILLVVAGVMTAVSGLVLVGDAVHSNDLLNVIKKSCSRKSNIYKHENPADLERLLSEGYEPEHMPSEGTSDFIPSDGLSDSASGRYNEQVVTRADGKSSYVARSGKDSSTRKNDVN